MPFHWLLQLEAIELRAPFDLGFTTSPVAVSFITDYRSFMLMHALFALAENELESIATLFTTYFVDMIGYMEEEWNNLVTYIKTGEIPDWDGTDHVREYVQVAFIHLVKTIFY